MDSTELTKIAAAVLLALLLIFGFRTIVDSRMASVSDKPGFTLPAATPAAEAKAEPAKDAAAAPAEKTEAKPEAKPEAGKEAAAAAPAKEAAAPDSAPAAAGGEDIVPLLAKASADNGKTVFNKCKSCHVAEKGKTPTVGPNLWGVVNRPKGSYEGFKYSDGMKAKGGDWSFTDIGHFLANPKAFVPGTKMVFAGLQGAEAADVIAYLATLADTPVALPK